MPQISSVGLGIPEHSYSQKEIFSALGHRKIFWDLFSSAGIDKRHLCLSPGEVVRASAQEEHENYTKFALDLSCKAITDCLGKVDLKPEDVGILIYLSCTGGFSSPATNWEIAHQLGMKEDVIHIPVSGGGCASGGIGLKLAWELLRLYPLKKALVCTTEISNAAFHPSAELGVIVGNSLFADGSSCYLLEGITSRPGLSLLDFKEFHDYSNRWTISMVWDQARYKIVLPRRATELTTPMVKKVLEALLGENSLDSISHFIFHSGGRSILDEACSVLGVPEEKLEHSYWTWKNHGNMSSATIGFALHNLLYSRTLKEKDHICVVTLGAGFTGHGILMIYQEGGRSHGDS